MKGTKLVILVLMGVALFMIGAMFILSNGDLTSWSKADVTKYRWMLGIILTSISGIWAILAFKHKHRDEILISTWSLPKFALKKSFLTWHKKPILYRHAFMYNALFFLMIMVFGLGGGVFSIIMHYVWTSLAAITSFLIVVRSEKNLKRTIHEIYMIVASLVWVMGFFGIVFTIYFGEFLFASRVLVWLENQIEKIES
jgi:hypothetical protein